MANLLIAQQELQHVQLRLSEGDFDLEKPNILIFYVFLTNPEPINWFTPRFVNTLQNNKNFIR